MKGRKQTGQNVRKPLSDDQREAMVRESRACLVVQFHNKAQEMKFWSKCNQRKQHRHIGDAINYLIWMVDVFWKGEVSSAAIFDTRSCKSTSAENKVYQYDRNSWKLEKPITW